MNIGSLFCFPVEFGGRTRLSAQGFRLFGVLIFSHPDPTATGGPCKPRNGGKGTISGVVVIWTWWDPSDTLSSAWISGPGPDFRAALLRPVLVVNHVPSALEDQYRYVRSSVAPQGTPTGQCPVR